MPNPKLTAAKEAAEMLAAQALTFIASDIETLGRFLALTGVDPRSIRSAAHDPQFLSSVLEYISSDEKLLVDFAREKSFQPGDVSRALMVLRGPGWERETA